MKLVYLILVCLVMVTIQVVITAQSPAAANAARKIEEFGDICCDAERARLENLLNELQSDPTAQGHIVFYGGRFYDSCWYGGKRHGKRRPRRGEAEARAARLVPYLIEQKALDPWRVSSVNGGYRESWTAELWIVPAGTKLPSPTPTLQEKNIRYRKGRATAQEFNRQCQYSGGLSETSRP